MKQRQKKLLCSLISSTLLWGLPTAALADKPEETFAMDDIVITANRMPTKLSETAANVTIVSREDMERKSLKTMAEALTQAGVQIAAEGGSGTDEAKIILNGTDQVVVLVDGRKVNWEQQIVTGKSGYNLNTLPNLESVEKIEVVRGAGSSLYGSSAAGGVINIITRKGAEKNTVATTEFGSWDSRRYRLQTSGNFDNTGYFITAEQWTQNNYEYKEPSTGQIVTMPNSDFKRKTASVRLDKDLSKGKTLTFYFDHMDQSGGTPIGKPGTALYTPDAHRDIVSNNVSLAYCWHQGDGTANNLQIYRNHYHGFYYHYRFSRTPGNPDSTTDNETDGIEWNQSRRLNDKHTLLSGIDWRNSRLGIEEVGTAGSKMRNLGLFVEDNWTLDPQWTVSAGVRRDDHNIYGSATTSHININRKMNETTNLYLSWGEVFKGPDVDDLFIPDFGWYRGNPSLKPEKGHTTTLGINTRLPGGTKINASLFSADLKDAIKWGGTVIWEPINIAEQKRQGFDLGITQPLSKSWDLTAGYSYLQVKENHQDGSGYQLDAANSNPNAYRLGLNYHKDAWNLSILGRGATGRSLDCFTAKEYWVLDIAANYQLKPDVKVYAKVYNLTNRAYETNYLDYWGKGAFPMASRQIVVGVERRL